MLGLVFQSTRSKVLINMWISEFSDIFSPFGKLMKFSFSDMMQAGIGGPCEVKPKERVIRRGNNEDVCKVG